METAELLRKRGVHPLAIITCAECKKGMMAKTSIVFECEYVRMDTQEAERGYMMFCSYRCVLLWPTMTQLGGTQ